MKFNEIISNVILCVAVFFTVRYFMQPKTGLEGSVVQSGQECVVVDLQEAQKPLVRQVDYEHKRGELAPETLIVESGTREVLFSHYTGSITALRFNHMRHGGDHYLSIFSSVGEEEAPAFLVALNGKTPVRYTLVEHKKEQAQTMVTYQAEGESATILKQFTLFHETFKISMRITLIPKKADPVQPRIFIPQPYLAEMGDANMTMALFNTTHKKLEKRKPEATLDRSWIKPQLFGIENRYFVTALVVDNDGFVQRGYYTQEQTGHLTAILEGPLVTESTSWSLDFYCGPKTESALLAVDSRLEATLDYGWFSFLAKKFTYLLTAVYAYVPNYGLVIVLITVLLTLCLLPFTFKSAQAMRNGTILRQKMQHIEQRYKHDPEALAREKAEIIKKYGIPEMAGCLPLFLQIPIFIGLQRAVSSSFELYQAPFFGWITDLSAKDPYYILPLCAALGFAIRTASVGNPRQRVQGFLMALIMGALFSNFSAGIVLYITVSTWLGVLQNMMQKTAK